MKKLGLLLVAMIFITSCKTTNKMPTNNNESNTTKQDTIRIANDKLEYEIIIIEPGFNSWLERMAKPEGYYSQEFLEGRNQIYVAEWNRRVLQPSVYDTNLYEMQIDYNRSLDYGYDVNYKLYNYFIYFQLHYKQQLSGLVPRI
ncbi:MAG: hypothetical protein DA407_08045 [Bacteroidetes bacterium]|nr:MAG: hypothetical protein DA407_08045 [Bacteroidota bacterium]